MQKDKRGRVRFGYNGYRFELTNKGLTIYSRFYCLFPSYGSTERALYPSEYALVLNFLLRSEEGRDKMADALKAMNYVPFTKAIHIPAHMKSVNS